MATKKNIQNKVTTMEEVLEDGKQKQRENLANSIEVPLPEIRGTDELDPESMPIDQDPYLVTYIPPAWLQNKLNIHRIAEEEGTGREAATIYQGIQFLPDNIDLNTIKNLQRQGVMTVERLSDWLRLTNIRKVQSLESGFTVNFARYLVENDLLEEDLKDFVVKAVRQYNNIEL